MTSLLDTSDHMLCFPAQTSLLIACNCVYVWGRGCEKNLEFEVRCLTLGISTPTVLPPTAIVPGGFRKRFSVVYPL